MKHLPPEITSIAKRITVLVLDVDGVLTDGTLYYSDQGEALKAFNVKDGLGIRLLMENGVHVAVITARKSDALARRMNDLGITLFYPGQRDKITAFNNLLNQLDLDASRVAYAGDDLIDLPVMRQVALPITVGDGHPLVKEQALWITDQPGGKGAVREIADGLLLSQNCIEDENIPPPDKKKIDNAHATFRVVIPARYASSRLPGKPLRQIAGKTMIERVYGIGIQSGASQVIVATDDHRIEHEVARFGGEVLMTKESHRSGTDRIAEVAEKLGWSHDTIVVNLQGDEPLADPASLAIVAQSLHDQPKAGIATLASPITSDQELFDVNTVKVVVNRYGMALYFSRAPIPWVRDGVPRGSNNPPTLEGGMPFLRHIGLYAYRVGVLFEVASAAPSPIESAESLEQLRAMAMGISIHLSTVKTSLAHGVDTEEDLAKAERLLSA